MQHLLAILSCLALASAGCSTDSDALADEGPTCGVAAVGAATECLSPPDQGNAPRFTCDSENATFEATVEEVAACAECGVHTHARLRVTKQISHCNKRLWDPAQQPTIIGDKAGALAKGMVVQASCWLETGFSDGCGVGGPKDASQVCFDAYYGYGSRCYNAIYVVVGGK